MKGGQRDEL